MASPATIDFHNAKMAQERARVALRIANGTKASSPNIISYRHSHPSFKGLPDNSTGSRNQPFFAMKDESQVSLEDKLAARMMRGGVLSTDAGQKYAKSILKRRAIDTTNEDLAREGLPVQPPPLLELDEVESRSLELNNIIDAIDDSLNAGTAFAIPLSEVSKLPRLLIALSPSFDERKVTALIDVLDDLFQRASTTRGLKQPVPIENATGDDEDIAVARLAIPLERSINFLKGAMEVVNMADERGKRLALAALAKEIFRGAFKAKEIKNILEQSEPTREEVAAAAPRTRRRLVLPPADAVAEEEGAAEAEEEAPVQQYGPITFTIDGRQVTFSSENAENYNSFREVFDALPQGSKKTAVRAMLRTQIQKGKSPDEAIDYTLARGSF
jgi:hypothetical protein